MAEPWVHFPLQTVKRYKNKLPEFPAKRIKFCTVDDDLEINRLEHLCEESKIAFVISEIIQGEGGMNVASRKFIKNLYGYN
jgi:4-aminobutyrate aminotransferase